MKTNLDDSKSVNIPVLVIISYWIKRSVKPLLKLLQQLEYYEAGCSFSVLIVCNGGDVKPLKLTNEFGKKYSLNILNRKNQGYNIGAWEYGWRNHPEYQYFLFLQDDCYIIRDYWLKEFITKMETSPNIGMVGESIYWQKSWEKIKSSSSNSYLKGHLLEGKPAPRVLVYLDFLARNNIPSGDTAEHLQSLILFTSKSILNQIDGFVIGNNYGEAIASEIAISKKVQGIGYNIAQINSQPFYYIGHREWPERSRLRRLWKKLWKMITL